MRLKYWPFFYKWDFFVVFKHCSFSDYFLVQVQPERSLARLDYFHLQQCHSYLDRWPQPRLKDFVLSAMAFHWVVFWDQDMDWFVSFVGTWRVSIGADICSISVTGWQSAFERIRLASNSRQNWRKNWRPIKCCWSEKKKHFWAILNFVVIGSNRVPRQFR